MSLSISGRGSGAAAPRPSTRRWIRAGLLPLATLLAFVGAPADALWTATAPTGTSAFAAVDLNTYLPTSATVNGNTGTDCSISWVPGAALTPGMTYVIDNGLTTVASGLTGSSTVVALGGAAFTPRVRVAVGANWISSNAVSAAGTCSGAPNAPAAVLLTPGDGSVTATWTAPATGLPPTGYTATLSPSGATCAPALPTMTCTFAGLTNGTAYTASVVATNLLGSSPATTSTRAVPFPAVLNTSSGGATPKVWLDASDVDGNGRVDGSAAEGGVVSGAVQTWADRTGNGFSLIADSGARPSLATQTMNSLPVITFNGSTILRGAASSNYGITGDRTMLVVARPRTWTSGSGTDGTGTYAIDRYNSSTPLFDVKVISNAWGLQARSDSGTLTSATAATVSSGRADSVLAVQSGTAGTISVAGGTAATAVVGTSTMQPITVGRHTSGTTAQDVDVAEVMLWSGVLSTADTRAVLTYLARKWAATITPDAPTNLAVSAGNATATATWTAPLFSGNSAVTSYTVTASPGGATCLATAPATSCTVSGLTNGTTYSFTVAASNVRGAGPASSTVSITPEWAPTQLGSSLTWWYDASNPANLSGTWTSAPVAVSGTAGSTTLTAASGIVERVDVLTGGTGYVSQPTVTLSAGGGSGFLPAAVTLASGAITAIASCYTCAGARGSGYTSEPTVTITGGGGSGATARARIVAPLAVGSTLRISGTTYTVTTIDGLALTVSPALAGTVSGLTPDVWSVSTWANSATPGTWDAKQATAANQPVLGVIGSKPAVVFNGIDEFMDVVTAATGSYAKGASWTALVAYQADRQIATESIMNTGTGRNARIFATNGAGAGQDDYQSAENLVAQPGEGVAFSDASNGGPVRVGTYNGSGTSTFPWSAASIGTARMGSTTTNGWNFTGRVGEIIFVNSGMTAAQRIDAAAYLARKWNLSSTVPLAPTGVTATPGSGSLAVAWRAANSFGATVTSSTATATAPGQTTRTCTTATLTCTITGLTPLATYSVAVTTTTAAGTSPSSIPIAAVPNTPVIAGLVAYYPMSDVSGTTLTDASGNRFDATTILGATLGAASARPADPGYSATAGANGLATLPSVSSLQLGSANAFTLSTWVNLTDTSLRTIAAQGTTTQGWSLASNGGSVSFAMIKNIATSDGFSVAASVPTGSWQHIVVTYSGSGTAAGVTIYVNGVAAAVTVSGSSPSAAVVTTTPIQLGVSALGYPAAGVGVEDFAIFSRVLTAAEAASLTVAPAPPAAPTLTVGSSGLGVAWSAPSYGASLITDYVIRYRLSGSGSWTTLNDGVSTATTATIAGLTVGSTYEVSVGAVNSVGQGPWSPIASGIPQLAWSPAALGSLALWFDAADASSLTTSAGAVSAWRDKSGFGRHAAQATTANQPSLVASAMGGRSALTFNGSSNFMTFDPTFIAGTGYTVASAVSRTSSAANNYYLGATSPSTNTGLTLGWRYNTAITHAQWGNDYDTTVPGFTSEAAEVQVFTASSTAGKSTYRNGSAGLSSANTTLLGTYASTARLGSFGSGFFTGRIGEMVVTTSALSTTDRQALEGYLAWKWGTQSSLDAAHPWRSIAPGIAPAAPSRPLWASASVSGTTATSSWSAPAWNGGSVVTGYTVTATASGQTTLTCTTVSTSCSIAGLTSATTYTLLITATNAIGTGLAAATTATSANAVLGAPGTPTGSLYTVSTLAGGSMAAVNGTGTAARFNHPWSTAVDSSGNVFVADAGSNTIRRVTAAGVVTTFAGTGDPGFGDGPGSRAMFRNPNGVAVDTSGNVYVADTGNLRIRKIDTFGNVTTLAGSGTATQVDATGTAASFGYPTALAVDSSGNVYVTDNCRIRKITSAGTVSTLAGLSCGTSADGNGTAAVFNSPIGIAVNSAGVLYVADTGGHVIRVIDTANNVTTLAGSGVASYSDGTGTAAAFNGPVGIAVDASGVVWVGERYNNRIRRITTGGVVTTFAGSGLSGLADGTGTAATFSYPMGVALDSGGNLYVADRLNGAIRKITSGGVVSTLAGARNSGFADGTGTAALFSNPYRPVADSAGNTYVADSSNHRIRKITAAGVVTTFAGSGVSSSLDGTGIAATFSSPRSLAIDAADNIYVADGSRKIRKITPAGVVTTIAGSGTSGSADNANPLLATFNSPMGITVDTAGVIYVTDVGSHTVRRLAAGGGAVTTVAGSGTAGSTNATGTAASFSSPYDVAVDASGNLFVADYGNNTIRRITPAGVVTSFVAGLGNPRSIVIDKAGWFWAGDFSRIRRISPTGTLSTQSGNGWPHYRDGEASTANFYTPVPFARPDGSIAIADTTNNNMRLLTPAATGSLFLSWAPPATNGGTAPTDYLVEYRVSPSGAWTTFVDGVSTTPAATITGLTNGTAYDLRVTAVNAVGNGAASSTVTLTPSISPGAPTALALTPGHTQLAASWTAPASTGGASITDYVVEYRTSPSGTWTVFPDGTSTATTATITGLTNGTAYDVRISAVNANGVGTASATGNGTPAPTAPGAPTSALASPLSAVVFAGSTSSGGTDGTGTAASFNTPYNGAFDSAGNLFVAEWTGNRIRKITPSGVVTTFAGSVAGSTGGTDGTGTAATFSQPMGLAFDSIGNLFVAEYAGKRIRKITPAGVVTTFAGSGATGSTDGTGTAASFNNPWGLAFDAAGDLYVADRMNNRVRKITPAGVVSTFVTTVGGLATDPIGLVFDRAGNLYVSSFTNGQIQKVTSGGVVSSFVTGLTGPTGVTIDPAGNLYASEFNAARVKRITPAGAVTLIAGSSAGTATGAATGTVFGIAAGVARDANGAIYVIDGGHRVIKVSPAGVGSLAVNWTAPASAGGSAVTDYVVEYRTSPSGTWTTFNDGVSATTSTTITGLTDGTAYDVRISAINAIGTGSASSSVTATPGGTPGAPTGFTVTPGNTQLAASWTAPAINGGAAITDYAIEYRTSPSGPWTVFNDGTSTATTATITGLTNGTAYDVRVSAVNSAGAGAASSTATATPAAADSTASYRSAVAADNPYISWRFDENSGSTAADSSPFANTGDVFGDASFAGSSGIFGSTSKSLTVDGGSSKLGNVSSRSTASNPTNISLEAWFSTSYGKGGQIIGLSSSRSGVSTTNDRMIYLSDDGRVIFGVRPSSTVVTISSPSTYADGNWHHVVATLGASGMRLYVDGALVASGATSTGASYTGYWRVGGDQVTGWTSAPNAESIRGLIDEVAVYYSELPPARITAHYNASGRP